MPALVTPDVRAADIWPAAPSPHEASWGNGPLEPMGATPPAILGTPAERIGLEASAAAKSDAGKVGGLAAWLSPGSPAFPVTVGVALLVLMLRAEAR